MAPRFALWSPSPLPWNVSPHQTPTAARLARERAVAGGHERHGDTRNRGRGRLARRGRTSRSMTRVSRSRDDAVGADGRGTARSEGKCEWRGRGALTGALSVGVFGASAGVSHLRGRGARCHCQRGRKGAGWRAIDGASDFREPGAPGGRAALADRHWPRAGAGRGSGHAPVPDGATRLLRAGNDRALRAGRGEQDPVPSATARPTRGLERPDHRAVSARS